MANGDAATGPHSQPELGPSGKARPFVTYMSCCQHGDPGWLGLKAPGLAHCPLPRPNPAQRPAGAFPRLPRAGRTVGGQCCGRLEQRVQRPLALSALQGGTQVTWPVPPPQWHGHGALPTRVGARRPWGWGRSGRPCPWSPWARCRAQPGPVGRPEKAAPGPWGPQPQLTEPLPPRTRWTLPTVARGLLSPGGHSATAAEGSVCGWWGTGSQRCDGQALVTGSILRERRPLRPPDHLGPGEAASLSPHGAWSLRPGGGCPLPNQSPEAGDGWPRARRGSSGAAGRAGRGPSPTGQTEPASLGPAPGHPGTSSHSPVPTACQATVFTWSPDT